MDMAYQRPKPEKPTKGQWIVTGIAIGCDVLVLGLGILFSRMITEYCNTIGNTIIPTIFNCGIIVVLFVVSILVVRIAGKKFH